MPKYLFTFTFKISLMNKLKSYTLNEVQDKLIGEKGMFDCDKFEYELQMNLIGNVLGKLDKNNI